LAEVIPILQSAIIDASSEIQSKDADVGVERRSAPPFELPERPLLPVSFAQYRVASDTMLHRWTGLILARSRQIQRILSSLLMKRLTSFGVPRTLHDFESPGPWSVCLLGMLIESDPDSTIVWQGTLDHIGKPIAADATFLALYCSDKDLAWLRRKIPGLKDALAPAAELLDLTEAISAFTFGSKTIVFPATELSEKWFNQFANRGLRRHRARLLGFGAGKSGSTDWPAWLTWEKDKRCPRAFVWMAAEWLLAMMRTLTAGELRGLIGTDILPFNLDQEESDEDRRGFGLPVDLENLCENTKKGDEIGTWVLHEIEDLIRQKLGEKAVVTENTGLSMSAIGRRRHRHQGESS